MAKMHLKVGPTRGEFFRIKKDWEAFENHGAWSRLRKVLDVYGLAREPWLRTNYPESPTGAQFLDVPANVPKNELVSKLEQAGFDVMHDEDAPPLTTYRETRLIKAYVNEVLTGFRLLNTTARDGVAGNVLPNGSLVTRQRGGVLDDAEREEDELEIEDEFYSAK